MPADPLTVYTLVPLKPFSISASPLFKPCVAVCKLKDVHGRRDPSSDEPGSFPRRSNAGNVSPLEKILKAHARTHVRTHAGGMETAGKSQCECTGTALS